MFFYKLPAKPWKFSKTSFLNVKLQWHSVEFSRQLPDCFLLQHLNHISCEQPAYALVFRKRIEQVEKEYKLREFLIENNVAVPYLQQTNRMH